MVVEKLLRSLPVLQWYFQISGLWGADGRGGAAGAFDEHSIVPGAHCHILQMMMVEQPLDVSILTADV